MGCWNGQKRCVNLLSHVHSLVTGVDWGVIDLLKSGLNVAILSMTERSWRKARLLLQLDGKRIPLTPRQRSHWYPETWLGMWESTPKPLVPWGACSLLSSPSLGFDSSVLVSRTWFSTLRTFVGCESLIPLYQKRKSVFFHSDYDRPHPHILGCELESVYEL